MSEIASLAAVEQSPYVEAVGGEYTACAIFAYAVVIVIIIYLLFLVYKCHKSSLPKSVTDVADKAGDVVKTAVRA